MSTIARFGWLFSRAHFKTFGNPTRKRGMSLELFRLQSLAHASGFRMSCKQSLAHASGFRMSCKFPHVVQEVF
jgi:hypothetical protein